MNNSAQASKAICAATLLVLPAYSEWNDKAFSFPMTTIPFSSQYVASGLSEEMMLAPCSILNHRKNILTAIKSLRNEYGESNWDGYGARPVSQLSIQHALLFADCLPATIEEPDIGVDADGEVTFEWYHDRENQCILAFGSDRTIYCNQKASGGRVAAQYRLSDFDKIMVFVNEIAANV